MQARLLSVVLWWTAVAQAARLLAVLPTNTKSHYVMYGRILEALAKKGHDLTVITHFPMVRTYYFTFTVVYYFLSISFKYLPHTNYYFLKQGFFCYYFFVPKNEQNNLFLHF